MKANRFIYLAGLSAACSQNAAGTGDLDVHVSGQQFVQSGWPAVSDGEEVAFADGWAVSFDHLVVHVEAFRLAEGSDEVIAHEPRGVLVDLRKGDADLWTLTDVKARRWPDVGYRFTAPSKHSEVAGKLQSSIEKTMRAEGYSLWLEGDGKKGERTVHFQLGIPGEVITSKCLNGRDETDGTLVGEGRLHEVEVTLHLDHLFWDDHDAQEPRLLFGPWAYAAGEDDLLTLDELRDQSLTDLRDENGDPLVDENGTPIVYVPRVELRENNLHEYLIDTALTLGHFNGEGHCQYEIRHSD